MLKLTASPTFKANVELPTTEGAMEFRAIFKYFTRDEWREYVAALGEKNIGDVVDDVLVGWENADTPFSKEALEKLKNVHHASLETLFQTFIKSLTFAKQENSKA